MPSPVLKVHGVKDLRSKIRYIVDRVPENGRKQMHRMADRIVKEARLNAPVLKHDIEQGIRKETGREARDAGGHGGRLKIDVVLDLTHAELDKYAVRVHENYEGMLVHGPGEKTREKMRAHPDRKIGSKFLTRAVDENRGSMIERLRNDIVATVKNIWNRRGGGRRR